MKSEKKQPKKKMTKEELYEVRKQNLTKWRKKSQNEIVTK